MNERIASLVGGIGCIQVGATSDIEQKENGKINYIPVQLQEFDEVKKDG